MLRRFLRRYIGVALGFSTAMTWAIVFVLNPQPLAPWWSQLLRALMVFSVLFLSQLGINAVVDPEVGAKLREKLENRQAQLKARRERLDRKDEEARKRLREAWRELKGERTTKP